MRGDRVSSPRPVGDLLSRTPSVRDVATLSSSASFTGTRAASRDTALLSRSHCPPPLAYSSAIQYEVRPLAADRLLLLRRWQPHGEELFCLACLATESVSCALPVPAGRWQQRIHSESVRYGASGDHILPPTLRTHESFILTCSPLVFVVYQRINNGKG